MKFIQKIAPTVYQYKCKDCGCLTNACLEAEVVSEKHAVNLYPSLDKNRRRQMALQEKWRNE